MAKQIFIDLETTGLDPKVDNIRQLAFIFVKNGKVVKKCDIKSNFYYEFTQELNKLIDKYNKDDKAYIIGQNPRFDDEFLRELFLKNKNQYYGSYFYNPPIDVMQLAAWKIMRKNRKRPENFKLGTLAKHFGVPVKDENLHDAMYDIEITRKLYMKLLKY